MEVIRKVVRKLRTSQNQDLCLWLIPGKDGRVRKVKIGFGHVCAGATMISMVVMGMLYLGVDYARFVTARARIESLIKKAKNGEVHEPLISEDYHDSLLSQIKFLTEEHNKSKNYEQQVRQRLAALQSALENGMPLEVFGEDPKLQSDKDVGGAELDCSNGIGPCLPEASDVRASLKWDLESLVPGTKDDGQGLLSALQHYVTLLETMPISRPVVGWVTSGFGLRRSPFTKTLTKHQGIDFSVPSNSQIVATADGIVKSVVRTRTYGLMIDIQHNNRVTTRYAHLNKASVKPGDKVCRGEIIGVSGSTGRSTGPHLHYEVRVDKKPVDPRLFLGVGASLSPDMIAVKD